jgi:hypothetical protein
MAEHVLNSPFSTRITLDEVTALVRSIYSEAAPVYDARTFLRMKDCVVTPTEVDSAIELGPVKRYEVTPSRSELRVEVQGLKGDMAKYCAVAYISTNHRLFVCDIRDEK